MTRATSEQLTPELVRSATFSAGRLGRRGCDEAQVRAFCEWVADGIGLLLNDNNVLQAEVMRLRGRLLEGAKSRPGIAPEDVHVQALTMLSKAQQAADHYVADAQEYSRELAEDAHLRRDEIVREAKVRASMILGEAQTSAQQAAEAARAAPDPLLATEHQELLTEVAYLRTYSDVCRTHLRGYLESLTRSIEKWEQAERDGARGIRDSVLHP